MAITSKPDHGAVITMEGKATGRLQTYFDDIEVQFSVYGTSGQYATPTLPTSDPGVSGALWNDAGTVKVST